MSLKKKNIVSKIYDIQTFINDNRILLLLILGFYIVSRLTTLISIILSFNHISKIEFYMKIIFQSVNIITLIIAIIVMKEKNEKIVIGIIIYNLLGNMIFNMFFLPNNLVVLLVMFFLELVFMQLTFYLIFHSRNVSLFLLLSSIIFLITHYFLTKDMHLEYDNNFYQFIFIEILYGIAINGIFLQILSKEYNNMLSFIKGLLNVDYNISLPNEKQLSQDFNNHFRNNEEISFIGIYITNLLSLNRQIGYANVQKELIKRTTEINNLLEQSSKLYKWEGPVFLFTYQKDNEELDTIIKNIENILNRPVRFNESIISFKFNALGTKCPADGLSVDSMLENLRAVKYYSIRELSKKEGIYWFSLTLLESSQRMLLLEKDIHKAIDNEEINIVIQPQISIIGQEKPAGGEVLARWKHPQYGHVSPIDFIPLIEHEGLMDKFTSLIISQTNKVIDTYFNEYHERLELAVNISASSLVTGYINELLIDGHLSGQLLHRMELELTENILFELNDQESKRFINELKKAGYKIAIDDFGSGFSNFEYLQELEIDILKIDKRIIDKMLQSDKSELVVNSIIEMAHTLGVEVVAEGVETLEQRNRLRELGCDYIQGYFYARPMKPGEFMIYIRSGFYKNE